MRFASCSSAVSVTMKRNEPLLAGTARGPPGKELDRIFDLNLSELSEDDTRQIAISLLPSDSTSSQADGDRSRIRWQSLLCH